MLISDDNFTKIALGLINSIPSVIAGIAGIAASYFAYRAHESAKATRVIVDDTQATANRTEEIAARTEINTNGKMEELLSVTKSKAFQDGKRSEIDNPGNKDTK